MQKCGLEPLGDNGGFVQQIAIERAETAAPPTVSVEGRKVHARPGRSSRRAERGPRLRRTAEVHSRRADQARRRAADAAGTGGTAQAPPVTTGAAIVLTLENPNAPKPPAGARLPSLPARMVGIEAAGPARPTTVALSKTAYDAVSALAEGTTVTVEAEVKPGQTSHTWNAVGRLTGSDPAAAKEVILLSAHLDHVGARTPPNAGPGADAIYNGADDDASGTIAVLELARALALGARPKRTIVFFGSEEAGGARADGRLHRDDGARARVDAPLQASFGVADGDSLWAVRYASRVSRARCSRRATSKPFSGCIPTTRAFSGSVPAIA